MAEKIDIVVPDLGDFDGVEVIEILVAVGDAVAREDGLITLETDKATMDIPAPNNGTINAITIAVGDTVTSGDVIGTMTIEVGDTVVVAPAINADFLKGDTTVIATPQSTDADPQTIEVPDLGDFDDVDIIEVHVVVGDKVSIDDPLVTIETDKAAMEVPSTAAGTITSVFVAVGDKVSKGSAVVVMDAEAVAVAPIEATQTMASPISSPPPAQRASQSPQKPRELPAIDESGFSQAHASPSVRKLARELGVDLAQVKGSALKNRIIHDDVKAFVKAVMSGSTGVSGGGLPKVPVIDFAKFGAIDTQALTRIQKISGPRLQASWINLPHVTQHDLADITELEAKRQQLKVTAKEKGIGLTPLAFILKACIAALKKFPKVNASLSENGEALIFKKYYHLGFAADTENGLMVPVIRDADRMDVYEIASALGALSASARDGKLKGAELQGASFTISSLGGIGGTAFTPIVNAPEVAILGVCRSAMQPVWNGTEFEPRLMLPISFSYDHRVIDGAYAVRFTTYLCQQLADVDSLLAATL
jgi:pyruvate dehydrogenase E2 component (dihydrolipoamide acetyltransferase)